MFSTSSVQNHKTCWDLLPWYVNDTLEPAERAGVEQHFETCDACRREVAALKDLRLHVRDTIPLTNAASADAASMARGLHQVQHRIDERERIRTWPSPGVRWVLAGQAAAILLLASMLAWPTAPEQPKIFETLSAPPKILSPEEGDFQTLRIVFDDDAKEIGLRRLLRSVNAEIVGGPTDIGAYTLRVERRSDAADSDATDSDATDSDATDSDPTDSDATDSDATVLSRLRADPLVRLAEPVL